MALYLDAHAGEDVTCSPSDENLLQTILNKLCFLETQMATKSDIAKLSTILKEIKDVVGDKVKRKLWEAIFREAINNIFTDSIFVDHVPGKFEGVLKQTQRNKKNKFPANMTEDELDRFVTQAEVQSFIDQSYCNRRRTLARTLREALVESLKVCKTSEKIQFERVSNLYTKLQKGEKRKLLSEDEKKEWQAHLCTLLQAENVSVLLLTIMKTFAKQEDSPALQAFKWLVVSFYLLGAALPKRNSYEFFDFYFAVVRDIESGNMPDVVFKPIKIIEEEDEDNEEEEEEDEEYSSDEKHNKQKGKKKVIPKGKNSKQPPGIYNKNKKTKDHKIPSIEETGESSNANKQQQKSNEKSQLNKNTKRSKYQIKDSDEDSEKEEAEEAEQYKYTFGNKAYLPVDHPDFHRMLKAEVDVSRRNEERRRLNTEPVSAFSKRPDKRTDLEDEQFAAKLKLLRTKDNHSIFSNFSEEDEMDTEIDNGLEVTNTKANATSDKRKQHSEKEENSKTKSVTEKRYDTRSSKGTNAQAGARNENSTEKKATHKGKETADEGGEQEVDKNKKRTRESGASPKDDKELTSSEDDMVQPSKKAKKSKSKKNVGKGEKTHGDSSDNGKNSDDEVTLPENTKKNKGSVKKSAKKQSDDEDSDAKGKATKKKNQRTSGTKKGAAKPKKPRKNLHDLSVLLRGVRGQVAEHE